jgi:acyl-CoA-binding protein
MSNKLNTEFEEAYAFANNTTIKLAPDIMLAIYAYYKQATKGNNYEQPSGDIQLRNSFKLNAWFQLSHLPENEAKQEYINLVNKHLKQKNQK